MAYDYLKSKDEKAIEKDLFGEEPDKTVIFEDQVTLDKPASDAAQKPIFKSGTYVRIKVHDRETGAFMSYPVRDHHKNEYPEAWARYCSLKTAEQGTPTDVLLSFGVPPEDVATMKSQGALYLEGIESLEGFDAAKKIAKTLLSAKEVNHERRNEGPPAGQRGGGDWRVSATERGESVHPQRLPVSTDAEGSEYRFQIDQTGQIVA